MSRKFISQMQNAFYLLASVDARIVGRVSVFAATLRTAKIHSAGQFPNANKIGSFNQLGTKWRFVDERRKSDYGTNIAVQTQLFAHAEQPLFGTNFGIGVVVVFGITNGTEKHGIRLHAKLMRFGRIGVANGIYGTSPYEGFFEFQLMTKFFADCLCYV